jgi:hypothetical protein
MSQDLNPQQLPKPPQRSRRLLRASGHAHPANDKRKPTVSFQYLQVFLMVAVFLALVALLWVLAIVL